MAGINDSIGQIKLKLKRQRVKKRVIGSTLNRSANASMIQKLTLRSNNKALAQALESRKQELKDAQTLICELRQEVHVWMEKYSVLERVAGLKDAEIDLEVRRRIAKEMRQLKAILAESSSDFLSGCDKLGVAMDTCNERMQAADYDGLSYNSPSPPALSSTSPGHAQDNPSSSQSAPPQPARRRACTDPGLGDMSIITEGSFMDIESEFSEPESVEQLETVPESSERTVEIPAGKKTLDPDSLKPRRAVASPKTTNGHSTDKRDAQDSVDTSGWTSTDKLARCAVKRRGTMVVRRGAPESDGESDTQALLTGDDGVGVDDYGAGKNGVYDGVNSGVDDGLNSGVDDGLNSGVDDVLNSGVDDGLNSGVDDGLNSGVDDGRNNGIDDGLNSGVDDGRNNGVDDGLNSGVDDGLNSGVDDGRNNGIDDCRNNGADCGRDSGVSRAETDVEGNEEQVVNFIDASTVLDRTKCQVDRPQTQIEVRMAKPGQFVYAAGRKNSDGIRAEVPSKLPVRSKARKLKKGAEAEDKTPEGCIPSIFDFHDRTPAVTMENLEGVVKEVGSVFDLTASESICGEKQTLNEFIGKRKRDSGTERRNCDAPRMNTTYTADDHGDAIDSDRICLSGNGNSPVSGGDDVTGSDRNDGVDGGSRRSKRRIRDSAEDGHFNENADTRVICTSAVSDGGEALKRSRLEKRLTVVIDKPKRRRDTFVKNANRADDEVTPGSDVQDADDTTAREVVGELGRDPTLPRLHGHKAIKATRKRARTKTRAAKTDATDNTDDLNKVASQPGEDITGGTDALDVDNNTVCETSDAESWAVQPTRRKTRTKTRTVITDVVSLPDSLSSSNRDDTTVKPGPNGEDFVGGESVRGDVRTADETNCKTKSRLVDDDNIGRCEVADVGAGVRIKRSKKRARTKTRTKDKVATGLVESEIVDAGLGNENVVCEPGDVMDWRDRIIVPESDDERKSRERGDFGEMVAREGGNNERVSGDVSLTEGRQNEAGDRAGFENCVIHIAEGSSTMFNKGRTKPRKQPRGAVTDDKYEGESTGDSTVNGRGQGVENARGGVGDGDGLNGRRRSGRNRDSRGAEVVQDSEKDMVDEVHDEVHDELHDELHGEVHDEVHDEVLDEVHGEKGSGEDTGSRADNADDDDPQEESVALQIIVKTRGSTTSDRRRSFLKPPARVKAAPKSRIPKENSHVVTADVHSEDSESDPSLSPRVGAGAIMEMSPVPLALRKSTTIAARKRKTSNIFKPTPMSDVHNIESERPRRSAMKAVSYKEPSLHRKMRRTNDAES